MATVHHDLPTVQAADLWPDWTDEEIIVPTGTPEVDGVAYTLPDFLGEQASYYASLDTAAGRWVARMFRDLAAEAQALDALTCEDFDGRLEIMMPRGS